MKSEEDRGDIIQELRSKQDLDFFQDLISDVENEDKEIDIGSTEGLFNDRIELSKEPEGNVKINGHWVHPIYARIVNQLVDGLSPIIIIVGKEGYGKSMTGLQLAITLHEKLNVLRGDFNLQNQVIYQVLEFLFLERQSTRTAEMFEEANETLNSGDYQSKMNKAVAGAVRTQRKRQNVKIFVAPEYKKIDKRIRQKVDVLIEMKNEQFADVKSYRYKHGKRGNRGLDYSWRDYPYWSVPDVPEDRREEYDKIDNQFKGSYLDSLIEDVLQEQIEEKEEEKTASI